MHKMEQEKPKTHVHGHPKKNFQGRANEGSGDDSPSAGPKYGRQVVRIMHKAFICLLMNVLQCSKTLYNICRGGNCFPCPMLLAPMRAVNVNGQISTSMNAIKTSCNHFTRD